MFVKRQQSKFSEMVTWVTPVAMNDPDQRAIKSVGRLSREKRLLLCLGLMAIIAITIATASTPWTRLHPSAVGGKPLSQPAPPRHEWVADYLNYTSARCARLIEGDAEEQAAAQNFSSKYKKELDCYRDEELGNASCSQLQIVSCDYSPSQQELDFPLAFSLRVHTCATQIELLLRSIYAPQNFYCIHADGRAPPRFLAAIRRMADCLPNVRLARLDLDFVYASASQMNADMECMRVARASPVQWRYFINLAGQELPLKTNLEMVRTYENLNGSSHFNIYKTPTSNVWRQTTFIWCKDPITNRTVNCASRGLPKPPIPGNLTIYKSYSNGAFSRAFVEYMLDDPFSQQLHEWFSDTHAPEEHYFATLLSLPSAPGGVQSYASERAMLWDFENPSHQCAGRYIRYICNFASGDLPYVVQRPELFANKFQFEEHPLAVRCLVDIILERRRNQSIHFSDTLGVIRSKLLHVFDWIRPHPKARTCS